MRPASAAIFLAVVLSGTTGVALASDTHPIEQRGRTFRPDRVSIARGDRLVISNQDNFIHQIYVKSNAMNFDSDEQDPGTNVSVNFPASGTFEVRCHIHPTMSLIVNVR